MAAGYRVYKRTIPDGPDELVTTLAAGVASFSYTGSPHERVWLHVRAVNANDTEDVDPVRLAFAAFDVNGDYIDPVPAAPFALQLSPGAGGAVSASWSHNQRGAAEPQTFNLYVATGADQFDFSTPDYTLSYSQASRYTKAIGSYADGTVVRCVVRAATSGGAEEANQAVAQCLAADPSLDAPDTITVSVDDEGDA